jgi:hypothetical protein
MDAKISEYRKKSKKQDTYKLLPHKMLIDYKERKHQSESGKT